MGPLSPLRLPQGTHPVAWQRLRGWRWHRASVSGNGGT